MTYDECEYTQDPLNSTWVPVDASREAKIYKQLRSHGLWSGECEPSTPNCDQVELHFYGN